MSLTNGGIIAGALHLETWNEKPASASGSTIISLLDGSTVNLGHFDASEYPTGKEKYALGLVLQFHYPRTSGELGTARFQL